MSTPAELIVHEHNLGAQEPSLKELAQIAKSYRLRSSSEVINWEELFQLENVFPLIARLEDGSYCIIAGIDRSGELEFAAVLHPGRTPSKVLTYTRSQFTKMWQGEVIFLKRKASPQGRSASGHKRTSYHLAPKSLTQANRWG